jgi:hypothetical protein
MWLSRWRKSLRIPTACSKTRPDELIDPQPRLWPATDTVPFHYPHPVTRKPIVLDNSRAREGFKKS